MAKRWIRDLALTTGVTSSSGYLPQEMLVIYHMLRTAGWTWLWECDGGNGVVSGTLPNHVLDGSMEDPLTTNWTVGAGTPTITKDTAIKHSGSRSLKIAGALGDVIQSANLNFEPFKGATGAFWSLPFRFQKATSGHDFSTKWCVGSTLHIRGAVDAGNNGDFAISSIIDESQIPGPFVARASNPGLTWWIDTPMHLAMWVNNPGTETWNVDIDPGTGVVVNLGSFGPTSGWELKHFDISITGYNSITVYVKPQGASSSTVYIDDVMAFRSFYEFTGDFVDYADGDTGAYVAQYASNEFESSAYTFVAGDIGKVLFLYDDSGSFPKNTGAYVITGVVAGRAVLNLRSSTAVLQAQDGSVDALNWRMVNVNKWDDITGSYNLGDMWDTFQGFALESPHTSKWRFVYRGATLGATADNYRGGFTWSAPEDTDFNVDQGDFFDNGPHVGSTGYNKSVYTKGWASQSGYSGDCDKMFVFRGQPGSATYTAYINMMFDDDGKFVFWATQYSTNTNNHAVLLGYVGDDIYHPGVEGYVHLTTRDWEPTGGVTSKHIAWDYNSDSRWSRYGVGFGRDKLPRRIMSGHLGYGAASDHFFSQANARANPFSGDEWITPLMILRDPLGNEGDPSERELTEGIYIGRTNRTLRTTFGNEHGVGDSFVFVAGPNTVTLTDAAGLFTAEMVGKEVTVVGATTPGNNGTFTVTAWSPTTLQWVNASGATEAFTGTWSVNLCRYLHIENGLCIDWMNERLA